MPNRANQSVSQTVLKSLAYRVVQPSCFKNPLLWLFFSTCMSKQDSDEVGFKSPARKRTASDSIMCDIFL